MKVYFYRGEIPEIYKPQVIMTPDEFEEFVKGAKVEVVEVDNLDDVSGFFTEDKMGLVIYYKKEARGNGAIQ